MRLQLRRIVDFNLYEFRTLVGTKAETCFLTRFALITGFHSAARRRRRLPKRKARLPKPLPRRKKK